MGILYAILIGAAAGWLAGKIMKGGGFGALINIILGIVGGAVGNWLFVL
ncbi:GlsB/YeaQ/YmgE family stress response membrane protein [Flagellimonas spongiicola]